MWYRALHEYEYDTCRKNLHVVLLIANINMKILERGTNPWCKS